MEMHREEPDKQKTIQEVFGYIRYLAFLVGFDGEDNTLNFFSNSISPTTIPRANAALSRS